MAKTLEYPDFCTIRIEETAQREIFLQALNRVNSDNPNKTTHFRGNNLSKTCEKIRMSTKIFISKQTRSPATRAICRLEKTTRVIPSSDDKVFRRTASMALGAFTSAGGSRSELQSQPRTLRRKDGTSEASDEPPIDPWEHCTLSSLRL